MADPNGTINPSWAPRYVTVWYDARRLPLAWGVSVDPDCADALADRRLRERVEADPSRPGRLRASFRLGRPALA